MEVGRICVKTAGREAGRYCVIIKNIDKTYVLIDGNVKRKKCNILHLQTIPKKIDIKEGAGTEEVKEAFKKAGFEIKKKKKIKKEVKPKPVKKPRKKRKPKKEKKKKRVKKEEKKEEKPKKKERPKKKPKVKKEEKK